MDSCDDIFKKGCLNAFVNLIGKYIRENCGTWELGADSGAAEREESVRTLLDEAYKASLMEEEGRKVRFRLLVDLFHSPDSETGLFMQVRFAGEEKVSADTLRRFAPMVPPDEYGLVVYLEKDKLLVRGISNTRFAHPKPPFFELLITAPGCMNMSYGEETIYSYKRGAIVEYEAGSNVHRTENKPQTLAHVFGTDIFKDALDKAKKEYLGFLRCRFPEKALPDYRKEDCHWFLCMQLAHLVRRMRKAGHGGAIFLIPSFEQTQSFFGGVDVNKDRPNGKWQKAHMCRRGTNTARPPFNWPGWFLLEDICITGFKSGDYYHQKYNDSWKYGQFYNELDASVRLTAMDGGVFLGPDFQPLLFGVHLHIPERLEIAEYEDGFTEEIKANNGDDSIGGGLRHRSACAHCLENGHIGFVMSQDGELTVLCSRKKDGRNRLVAWQGIEDIEASPK